MNEINSSFKTSAENIYLYARNGSQGNTAYALKSFYQQGMQSPIDAKKALIEAEHKNHEILCERYLLKKTGADINLVMAEAEGMINYCLNTFNIWVKIRKAQFSEGNNILKQQFNKSVKIAQKSFK